MLNEARLARFAHALGCYRTAWHFAGAELRHAVQIGSVSAAWDVYRRDAGAGEVGRDHAEIEEAAHLATSSDDRRDAVLLWLSDHATPIIGERARQLAGMMNAGRRFSASEQALLDIARDAVRPCVGEPGPIARHFDAGSWPEDCLLLPLRTMISAVDTLRRNPDFAETTGGEARTTLPGGTFVHYVPANPGAAWALNLAFLAQGAIIPGTPPPPGLISRALFRTDLEVGTLASDLVDGAAHALEQGYASFQSLGQELQRGRIALAGLSRNARAKDAWLLVATLQSVTRAQISRALGLSRAGGDIQARALSNAGLVTLSAAGRVRWRPFSSEQAPLLELDGSLGEATAGLDEAMAKIDELLARHTRKTGESFVS